MTTEKSLIIYDGDCIFCQNYVRLVRLKQAIGEVELLDARSDDPRVAAYWRDGFDLNEGMLFFYRGQVFHGAQAVHMMATFTSPSSAFNRLNARIFSSETLTRLLYPLLKLGRRATLIARGRSLMARR